MVSITDPNGIPTITIVRVFSGHRDAHGRMLLTTDYDRVYAELERGGATQLGLPADWKLQFHLAIRADTIVTATLFSPSVYARFTADWQERLAQYRP